jgi:hypothetical protein
MKRKYIAGIILAAAIASPASAQGFDPARVKQVLDVIESADSNRDGKTTSAEFRAAREAQFKKSAGKDSHLDLATVAKTAEMKEKLLDELDANDDGKISQAEYVNNKPRIWGRIDKDGDDAISATELKTIKARVAARG